MCFGVRGPGFTSLGVSQQECDPQRLLLLAPRQQAVVFVISSWGQGADMACVSKPLRVEGHPVAVPAHITFSAVVYSTVDIRGPISWVYSCGSI